MCNVPSAIQSCPILSLRDRDLAKKDRLHALNGISAALNLYRYLLNIYISTTNLAACVCVCAKFDQFLPVRFYFVSKRPNNFVRIAKFPYAAFGPLFAFHCPLFVTKNNNLGWNRQASPHTGTGAAFMGRRYCLRADNRRASVCRRVGSLWPSFEARLQAASWHLTYSIYTAKL